MKTNHPTTHKIRFAGRRLSWAFAACLALGALPDPAAHAATDAANAAALSTNLPSNVTLAKASVDQVAGALHEAVKQHHDDAVDLLKIAILAKTPKQGHGELACADLKKLVRAAISAATDKASQCVDMAASLHPECADGMQDTLTGMLGGDEAGGFGNGFGPGFPGSPGFVGSPPSGGVALPSPAATPVTSVTNN